MEPNAATNMRGHFTYGFEVARFVPCGSSEQWWVSDGIDQVRRHVGQLGSGYGTIYIEFVGVVSEPGKFGHLGAYRREVKIEQVVLVDEPRKDCRAQRLP
jgi:hypothetical protein